MIHNALAGMFNFGRATITKLFSCLKTSNGFICKSQRIRPQITSFVMNRNFVRTTRNSSNSWSDSGARSNDNFTKPSFTNCRTLSATNLYGRRFIKKHLVGEKNRKASFVWATHLTWILGQWRRVFWSDESKFNLSGSDGVEYIRQSRFAPQYQYQFWTGRISPLCRINGNMNHLQ